MAKYIHKPWQKNMNKKPQTIEINQYSSCFLRKELIFLVKIKIKLNEKTINPIP